MAKTAPAGISDAAVRRRGTLDRIMGSRFGKLLGRIGVSSRQSAQDQLFDLAGALLSLRGRASGPALASAFFDLYEASDMATRHVFLAQIHDRHPHDGAAIDQAIARWQRDRGEDAALALSAASEAPCQKLIRMLNLAPQGTKRLIAMRTDLLAAPRTAGGIKALDNALEDAFTDWFNAGFLDTRRIGWNSEAKLLEKIIRYEAVHSIDGWDDLRRRVEPVDRRCYGFFHPQMADEPLIFVEVALTSAVPGAISDIIAETRGIVPPHEANCAIFYSISNCQKGLRGIPFGNYLIKRVVGLLREELPQLRTFATLSPVPGFARWLARQPGADVDASALSAPALRELAALYLTDAKTASGTVADSVARFHLGNGARLDAVHAGADMSAKGMRESHGVMVNYVYDLDELEANHFALTEFGTVAASKPVRELADAARDAEEQRAKAAA